MSWNKMPSPQESEAFAIVKPANTISSRSEQGLRKPPRSCIVCARPIGEHGCHAFAAHLQNPEPEYFPAKACRPCKFACFRGAIGVFHLLANDPRKHGTRNVGWARNLRLHHAWLA